MTDLSMPDPDRFVTLGVDTHADLHAAAALDERGRLLDSVSLPSTPAGYQALLDWAARLISRARPAAGHASRHRCRRSR